MEAYIDNSTSVSGGTAASAALPFPQIMFKFKGNGRFAQPIDYVSTADRDFRKFAGGYRSTSPNDIGNFRLERRD